MELRSLSRIEVADVVGRRLRRIVVQRDAAGLLLELRDGSLVGLGRGCKLSENGAAALLTLHGWRHCLIIEVFVAAGETHQRNQTNGTTALHELLAEYAEGVECKSYAAEQVGARRRATCV